MLDKRHFTDRLSGKSPKWETLIRDKVVVQCKDCGKWIWSLWHEDCHANVSGRKVPILPPMEKCGLCFFKK